MDVVYLAYDPELDRKLALKLLRPDRAEAAASSRILREAQAMARLSHPNVVPVYDVGTVDGQIFVAMEFIEGGTLADWLTAKPRSLREVSLSSALRGAAVRGRGPAGVAPGHSQGALG